MCIYHNLYPARVSNSFCPIASPLDLLSSLFQDYSLHPIRDRCSIRQATNDFGYTSVLCPRASVKHHARVSESLEILEVEVECDICQAMIESGGWKAKTLEEILKGNETSAFMTPPPPPAPTEQASQDIGDLDDTDVDDEIEEAEWENGDEELNTITAQPAGTHHHTDEQSLKTLRDHQNVPQSDESDGTVSIKTVSQPDTNQDLTVQEGQKRVRSLSPLSEALPKTPMPTSTKFMQIPMMTMISDLPRRERPLQSTLNHSEGRPVCPSQ